MHNIPSFVILLVALAGSASANTNSTEPGKCPPKHHAQCVFSPEISSNWTCACIQGNLPHCFENCTSKLCRPIEPAGSTRTSSCSPEDCSSCGKAPPSRACAKHEVLRCSESGDTCQCFSHRIERNCRSQCSSRDSHGQTPCIWDCLSQPSGIDHCTSCLTDNPNDRDNCEATCTPKRCHSEATFLCTEGHECECVRSTIADRCTVGCVTNCSSKKQPDCEQMCTTECLEKGGVILYRRCDSQLVLETIRGLARAQCVGVKEHEACTEKCRVEVACAEVNGSDAVLCAARCLHMCYEKEKFSFEWLIAPPAAAANPSTMATTKWGPTKCPEVGPEALPPPRDCRECVERNFLGNDPNACNSLCGTEPVHDGDAPLQRASYILIFAAFMYNLLRLH